MAIRSQTSSVPVSSVPTVSIDSRAVAGPGEPGPAAAPSRLQQAGSALAAFGNRTALVLIALGLLIVGLGYNGIAGANVGGQVALVAQMPYLISGGVLGLAVVIIGAALMITHAAREDRARLEAKFDALTAAVRDSAGAGPAAGTATVPGDAAGLVLAGSASYHAPGCRLVEGRADLALLTAAEAASRGLAACRVCDPARLTTPAG